MARDSEPDELGPFQFAVFLLSLALLVGLAADWFFSLPREVERLIFFVDTTICGVLFTDFLVRWKAARWRPSFMKWGWIDLLASVPAVDVLRFGRVLRIVRVIRMIVAIRSLRRFVEILWASKTRAGVAAISVIAFIVVSFGSAGILLVERTPEANIRTAEDALWWSMTTVTTVGYGDRYPVTTAGRVIATALMICGIGIFGTLSGVAAGLFLGNDRDEPASREAQRELLAQVDALQRELAALKAAATSTSQSPPPPPSEGSTGSSTST